MKVWLVRRIHEIQTKESLEEEIARETTPDKFKYEIKNIDGKWEEVLESYFESEAAKSENYELQI
jgi:hypothetical protein